MTAKMFANPFFFLLISVIFFTAFSREKKIYSSIIGTWVLNSLFEITYNSVGKSINSKTEQAFYCFQNKKKMRKFLSNGN